MVSIRFILPDTNVCFYTTELILDRLPFFWRLLWDELGVLIILAVFGFLVHIIRNRRISLFLLLSFAGNTFYALNYRIQDIFPYFVPSYFFLIIFTGLEVLAAQEWFFKKRQNIAYAFIWIFLVMLLYTNYAKADLHEATSKINETQTIDNNTQPDSLVITSDYNVYEYMIYYWVAKGWRENNIYLLNKLDVDVIRAYIDQDQPIYLSLQPMYTPTG